METVIKLNIPDIDAVVQSEADLRKWVNTSLSEMIIKRLIVLKQTNDELSAVASRAVVIDDPKIETRGIGITMGAMQ